MANPKQDSAVTRKNIKDIQAQLDLVTARLSNYECNGTSCSINNCKFVSDGLRLSQEVEILRRQNAMLVAENDALRKQLHGEPRNIPAGI